MGIGMPKICGEYMNEKNAIEAARERVESGRVERPTKREREWRAKERRGKLKANIGVCGVWGSRTNEMVCAELKRRITGTGRNRKTERNSAERAYVCCRAHGGEQESEDSSAQSLSPSKFSVNVAKHTANFPCGLRRRAATLSDGTFGRSQRISSCSRVFVAWLTFNVTFLKFDVRIAEKSEM